MDLLSRLIRGVVKVTIWVNLYGLLGSLTYLLSFPVPPSSTSSTDWLQFVETTWKRRWYASIHTEL